MHISARRMGPRAGVLLSVLSGLVACNRYELRPVECPPPQPPIFHLASASKMTPELLGRRRAAGLVLDTKSREPVDAALVIWISADDSTRRVVARTDPQGAFRLDSLPARPTGRAVVRVSRLGYDTYQSVVQPSWPAEGGVLMIQLHLKVHVIHACSPQYYRKPWWKWW